MGSQVMVEKARATASEPRMQRARTEVQRAWTERKTEVPGKSLVALMMVTSTAEQLEAQHRCWVWMRMTLRLRCLPVAAGSRDTVTIPMLT